MSNQFDSLGVCKRSIKRQPMAISGDVTTARTRVCDMTTALMTYDMPVPHAEREALDASSIKA